MAADNAQALIHGFARVVSNGTTPPNGFIQGNLIQSIAHASAGVYTVTLTDDISLQEYDVTAQIQGAAGGQASVSRASAGVLQVNTFGATGSAADKDFTLTIALKRIQGANG